MKWKVLVTAPYMQPVLDRFREFFVNRGVELVVPEVAERLEEDALIPLIGDVDGVICGDDRFTRKVIEAAPKLKVLSKWGTGIDSLDAAACEDHGIRIMRTPDAFSVPVAESVLGYILCFSRQLPFMNRDMHKGLWKKIPGRILEECSLGVIGVGDAGKAVVRRAASLGMRVLGNDMKTIPDGFLKDTGLKMVSKTELLKAADFVTLHTDLNPTSVYLMNRDRFSLMRRDAVLINLSRGPVVDENALIEALRKNLIAGAALDVFEHEPLPENSPLLGMNNVFLAPHNANSSERCWVKVHRRTIENLMVVLEEQSK